MQYSIFYTHLCKESGHTDACETYNTAYDTAVSLRMNPRGSIHVTSEIKIKY